MSGRTQWIDKERWNRLTFETQKRIVNVLGKIPYEKYGANVENELRARGEHRLADRFLTEIIKDYNSIF